MPRLDPKRPNRPTTLKDWAIAIPPTKPKKKITKDSSAATRKTTRDSYAFGKAQLPKGAAKNRHKRGGTH